MQDKGTSELERTKADHVDVYYSREELIPRLSEYALLLVVSYRALETDLLLVVSLHPRPYLESRPRLPLSLRPQGYRQLYPR